MTLNLHFLFSYLFHNVEQRLTVDFLKENSPFSRKKKRLPFKDGFAQPAPRLDANSSQFSRQKQHARSKRVIIDFSNTVAHHLYAYSGLTTTKLGPKG